MTVNVSALPPCPCPVPRSSSALEVQLLLLSQMTRDRIYKPLGFSGLQVKPQLTINIDKTVALVSLKEELNSRVTY